MTFRARMLLFFVIIVVIPMIAVGLVLSSLTAESEVGRADSQLAQGLRTALSVYDDARAEAVAELREVTSDETLRRAFADGRDGALERAATRLERRGDAVDSIALYDERNDPVAAVGAADAVAYATATPTAAGGERIGRVAVSTTTAREYAQEVTSLTGLETRVVRDGARIATTLSEADVAEPLATTVRAGGEDFRGRYAVARDAVGSPVRVGAFQPAADVSSSISENRALVGAILVGFLLLALASSILVVRSLGRQIDRFLAAARQVGRGDFAARVPTKGRDEFAALGRQFNVMSAQLKENADELDSRRREREEAIRRIGEAFATGLDRSGIGRLAARTALEACSAEAGHAVAGELGTAEPEAVGRMNEQLRAALERAERAARESPDHPVDASEDGAHALATALRGRPEAEGRRRTLGYLAIARSTTPFDPGERDLFAYLAAQASVSLDNVSLHETVQAQAVTDPLTGLYNRRRLDATLDAEIGRTRRFGGNVGLLMLDLDGFKEINDVYGHRAGDKVLVEVATLLRRLTRDVDQLARYGGDEIAIVLPETDLGGSELLAERVRAGIESLAVQPEGASAPLPLTASFGTASLPESAADRDELLAAADVALYTAKRAGGNRVARADAAAVPR